MKTVTDASVKKSFDSNGNTDADDCDEDIVSDKRGSMFGRTEQSKKEDSELGPGQPKTEIENPEARTSDEMSSRLSMMWRDHSVSVGGGGGATAADPSKSFMFQLGAGSALAGQHDVALAASIGQANPIFKFDTFDKFAPAAAAAASRLRRGSCDDRTLGFCDVVDATGGDFSPASGRSPHSSLSSPQVNIDSPRICFSPLKIKDSVGDDDDDTVKGVQR